MKVFIFHLSFSIFHLSIEELPGFNFVVKGKMATGKCQMTNGKWKMTNGK